MDKNDKGDKGDKRGPRRPVPELRRGRGKSYLALVSGSRSAKKAHRGGPLYRPDPQEVRHRFSQEDALAEEDLGEEFEEQEPVLREAEREPKVEVQDSGDKRVKAEKRTQDEMKSSADHEAEGKKRAERREETYRPTNDRQAPLGQPRPFAPTLAPVRASAETAPEDIVTQRTKGGATVTLTTEGGLTTVAMKSGPRYQKRGGKYIPIAAHIAPGNSHRDSGKRTNSRVEHTPLDMDERQVDRHLRAINSGEADLVLDGSECEYVNVRVRVFGKLWGVHLIDKRQIFPIGDQGR
ncbi:MAG TPA: hypothetical protein VGM81_17890 [Burkholderiaceae bacterium]